MLGRRPLAWRPRPRPGSAVLLLGSPADRVHWVRRGSCRRKRAPWPAGRSRWVCLNARWRCQGRWL